MKGPRLTLVATIDSVAATFDNAARYFFLPSQIADELPLALDTTRNCVCVKLCRSPLSVR